ncbi:MAG TPA: lysine--tRNA ligase [Candidatus Paceibacterota bacterium]|nr:lysine--tRNA ligase [Candidatus Paceibacterota bacterium]
MSEQDIRAERLRKLDILKAARMEAYPADSHRDTSNADALAHFDELEQSAKKIKIGGRVMSLRGQGGIMFADLFDGTGKMQIVLQGSEMEKADFELFANAVDVGDFVEVSGIAFKTKRGEHSLQVKKWRMLAKSLLPIPDEWFGLKDEEKILRERYLDILLNPETRAMFERRARFWNSIRYFLIERGFLEVETPVLDTSPGGADARPFSTHHNALDIDISLRISLELPLKRLLVAGYPKVFEIGRVFRNEGQSREHLQDYTMLETYEAFSDLRHGGDFVKELYRYVAKEVYGKYTFEINGHTVDLADEWKVIDFCQIIKETFGIDPLTCTEEEAIQAVRDAKIEVGEELNLPRAMDHLWKSIRKTISGPAFLVGTPVYLSPLAKRFAPNPKTVERLQVLIAGSEVGNGYSELNDPQDQRARFEEQQKLRDAGDDEAQRLDEDYIRAMEYGMPPAFGFGVSERLFAFFENKPAHLAQLFPLLRPKS